MGVLRGDNDLQLTTETYLTQAAPVDIPQAGEESATEHAQNINTVTILIGAGAGLGVIVVAVLITCIIYARRRRIKRKKVASKYDRVFTTPRRISPFSSTGNNTTLNSRGDRKSVYNALDLVPTHPQIDNIDLKLYRTEKIANAEKLSRFHSLDESNDKRIQKPLKKSKSAAAFSTHGLQIDQEQNVLISFQLKYVANLRQLHLKLLGLFDLPVKTYGCFVNANVYLFPRNTEGVHSRSKKAGKDVQLQETFFFDDMTLAEVEKATLRIVVNYKKNVKVAKEGFLGELFVKCCDVDWVKDEPIKFVSTLLKTREKTGSTVDKYLLEDLGSLFVCLEYQQVANRLKVMVRKGSDFPKSDKLIGRPDHYVVINLMKMKKIVKVQETKTQGTNNPIWNQPFLFDVSGSDINDYSIDFVIMREKLHTKDAVVGHVHIGKNGSKSGRLHWKDITSPRPVETAKWHSILPVISFKEGNQKENHHEDKRQTTGSPKTKHTFK